MIAITQNIPNMILKNGERRCGVIVERERVCCNCGNNVRTEDGNGNIHCACAVDGHYIGYIECFEGWCRRWKKDEVE